jgi:hypothetical protein
MLSDDPDEGMFFCLHWRDMREYCPEKCVGFIEGAPQNLSSFPFEMTCEYFHRTVYQDKDSPQWSDFCLYHKVENPPCDDCKIKHQRGAKAKKNINFSKREDLLTFSQ